jgi:hypothetical protein
VNLNVILRRNSPPTIALTSPQNQSSVVRGTNVRLAANALDDVSVSRVEFLMDGRPYVSIASEPWEAGFLVPTNYAAGQITFGAVAYDGMGSYSQVSTARVEVVADTYPPVVTISSPRQGASFADSQNVLITAGGFDNVGVGKVEIKVNGAVVQTVDNPPILDQAMRNFLVNYLYDPPAKGSYQVKATAYDYSGNVNESNPVNITVVDDAVPTVSFRYPTQSMDVTIGRTLKVEADASDDGFERTQDRPF